MKKNYVLEWLDDVVSIRLNPEVKGNERLSNEETNEIKQRIEVEEREVLSRLKNRVFSIPDERASRLLVKKCHDALVLMIGKNYDSLHHPSTTDKQLKALHEYIGSRLHHIMLLFEKELAAYLGNDSRVPLTRLITVKQEILSQTEVMKEKLATGQHGMAPVDIVMDVMQEFIRRVDEREYISRRDASYIQELVHDVVSINGETTSITGCPVHNELLITWNLNSKLCFQYFTKGTQALMDTFHTTQEKVDFLKMEATKLAIIPEKKDFVLNPAFPGVKDYCSRWLKKKSKALEKKIKTSAQGQTVQDEGPELDFKVLVNLSIDQIAIILRAAFNNGVIEAKSLSVLFEVISKYISSKKRENISGKSMRNHSYNPEGSDVDIARETLHKVAAAINF